MFAIDFENTISHLYVIRYRLGVFPDERKHLNLIVCMTFAIEFKRFWMKENTIVGFHTYCYRFKQLKTGDNCSWLIWYFFVR